MRALPADYMGLELRAHSLLADVPLHDVWTVELPGGRDDLTMARLRTLLSTADLRGSSGVVRMLFRLRGLMGRVLAWDSERPEIKRSSYADRLTEADRLASTVEPGTLEAPFTVLLVLEKEAISEIHNTTVHAFSVFALARITGGHRMYWAIYVKPVGRLTGWYMALIDPFRRFIIYPSALREIRAAWQRALSEGSV